MDFMKILKSFEELVFESLTWLILLPRTLLRIVLHPIRMTRYAASELDRDDELRFDDAMSPPLLLILSLLIAHFADLGLRTAAPDASENTLADMILGSEQTLLLYRSITFGVWALGGATYFLMRTGQPVSRERLRAPLYEQCYLVAPFAFMVSVGVSLQMTDSAALQALAAVMVLVAFAWFWLVQATWMRRRAAFSGWHSAVAASVIIVVGATVNAGVGYLLTHGTTA